MISILSGSVSIGTLYAIYNFVLIPYLNDTLGSMVIPGYLVSIGMFLTIFVGMLIGYLSDKKRDYLLYIKVLFLLAFTSMSLLSLKNRFLLYFTTIVFVTTTFSIQTPYSAFVSNVSKEHNKDRNYGFVMGVSNISMFLSSILIGAVISKSIEFVIILLSLIGAIFVIPLLFKNLKNIQLEEVKEDTLAVSNSEVLKKVSLLLISQFGIWFTIGGVLPYATSFLKSEFAMSLEKASFYMGISTLISALFSTTTGIFSKIIGRKKLYMLTILTLLITFSLIFIFYENFLFIHSILLFLILFLFSGALGIIYTMNVVIISNSVPQNYQGKIFGINNIVVVLSQTISLSLMGSVIATFGYRGALIVPTLGMVIALIFYLLHVRSEMTISLKKEHI
ncbi:MAG TPA: MFS transporter [Candidatus Pacearchaeota archaeon]|nr:MFS transporter [Candidatus Pacearchaeota archaeon]